MPSATLTLAKGCTLANKNETRIAWDDTNQGRIFETFWRQAGSTTGENIPFWDSVVNYEIADLNAGERQTKVTPFYIQAAQLDRFRLTDSRTVPVYTISLDSNDSNNPIAVLPGVSELQMRLVQNFIDTILQREPEARFRLSAHFPVERILQQPRGISGRLIAWFNPFVSRAVRRRLIRLLSREEIFLFSSAHTHDRKVTNLTKVLKLDRKTALPEAVIPSLTDYQPVQENAQTAPHDGRALGIQNIWAEQNEDGKHQLVVEVAYQGLDPEDLLGQGLTADVRQTLDAHNRDHSYQKTLDVMREKFGKPLYLGLGGWFGRKLVAEFVGRRIKSGWGFLHTVALPLPLLWVPVLWKRAKSYWFEHPSIIQDTKNALTTVSAEQVFNEVEHFIPFLESLTTFIERETVAGDTAAEALLQGVREVHHALRTQFEARRPTFDAAVAARQDATALAQYNDILHTAGVFRLPSLLVGLKEDGEARAFAVLAGLEASRIEYKFQGQKPTQVPNEALTMTIALDSGPQAVQHGEGLHDSGSSIEPVHSV